MKKLSFDEISRPLERGVGAIPLYFQIVEVLEDRISDAGHIGFYLPAEAQLCSHFQVSRITIRKSMEELQKRGIVLSERAKGARILSIPQKRSRYHGIGFSSRYKDQGKKISSRIVKVDTMYRNTVIASKLGDAHAALILLKRVRLVDDVPVAYETSYLQSIQSLREAVTRFTEDSSLYQTLQDVFSWRIDRAEEAIRAVLCNDKDVLRQLENKNTPLLFTSRTSYAVGIHTPVEYCESYIKSEYYGIVSYSYANYPADI